MNALFTLTTADSFQHYLPLWYYAARRYCGEELVIGMAVCGGLVDAVTTEAFKVLGTEAPMELPLPKNTPRLGGIGAMRFLLGPLVAEYNAILLTDADLLLTDNPMPYMLAQLDERHCFAAHRGPNKKPYRPEITGPDGWRGEFERVAGGFVMVTPEWYERTREARKKYMAQLEAGLFGAGWRELDEVLLARIIKDSGLPMPESKVFPTTLRGVHLGDAKPSMQHRWTNLTKMSHLLTSANGLRFRELEASPVWQELLRILASDTELMQILANMRTHLERRGI
jgi:hypothetical protein